MMAQMPFIQCLFEGQLCFHDLTEFPKRIKLKMLIKITTEYSRSDIKE